MTYDQQCQRIVTIARKAGYTALNIDYGPARLGQPATGYQITAHAPGTRVQVLIARATSWARCYAEAVEYLAPEQVTQ